MRKEATIRFDSKDFLKRLGFPEDALFIDVSTFQFMESERQIQVRVNMDYPESKGQSKGVTLSQPSAGAPYHETAEEKKTEKK